MSHWTRLPALDKRDNAALCRTWRLQQKARKTGKPQARIITSEETRALFSQSSPMFATNWVWEIAQPTGRLDYEMLVNKEIGRDWDKVSDLDAIALAQWATYTTEYVAGEGEDTYGVSVEEFEALHAAGRAPRYTYPRGEMR